jgi:hypothetical protein
VGGSLLSSSGVVFVDSSSDTHFGPLARILQTWKVPYRIIADRRAVPRVKRFGGIARTYAYDDFADLARQFYATGLKKTVQEVGSSRGEKDPAVARVLAKATEPPTPVVELWNWLRPFLSDPQG